MSTIVITVATASVVTGLFLWYFEGSRNERLYENQIAACERGNVSRGITRDLIEAQKTVNKTMIAFLESSVTFRESQKQYDLAKKADAQKQAVIKADAKLVPPEDVNCKATIPPP